MRKNTILITLIGIYFSTISAFATNPIRIEKKLIWSEVPISHNPTGNHEKSIWHFEDAVYNPKHPSLPLVSERFLLPSDGQLVVRVIRTQFSSLNKKETADDTFLKENIQFFTTIEQDRHQFYGKVFFIPITKKGNQYKKLTSFEVQIDFQPTAPLSSPRNRQHTFNSVLKDGAIYKIAVDQSGIYKIDYNFLKETLKIDIDNINPANIKLFGNGGGSLPEPISTFRYDDLQENAIQVIGGEDGRFDPNDYIIFYGDSPHTWKYDQENQEFNRITNIYDDNNYYFIKISSGNGLRVKDQNSISNTNYTTNAYDDYLRLEEDLINLLDNFSSAQGTGQDWYGDLFETIRERTYDDFVFPDILTSEQAKIKTEFAGRSGNATTFSVSIETNEYNKNIRSTRLGDIEAIYARTATISESFFPEKERIPVTIKYPQSASSTGWLDYIQLNVRRRLNYSQSQQLFRDSKTLDFPNSTFQISNVNDNVVIWDITNPIIPTNQLFDFSGNELSFGVNTSQLKEFIAFNANTDLLSPEAIGQIENQNLHNIDNIDLAIVYHKNFEQAASQLAEHRETHNGYQVSLVPIDQIYNEFSSGHIDPTAIRDFSKMLFDRNKRFRYLLLFGDGSFDYKNIKNLNNPSGFIPAYETKESLHPIEGFPTDDYYALLSDSEGGNLKGALDIATGRLPVKTPEEAQAVVNKILNYDKNPTTLGDWRLNQAFVADDEDSSIHQRQSNGISTKVDTTYDIFNVNKIFMDAFQQITTPGGQRYPAVKEAIANAIFKGTLIINYIGHGGSKGWAQERILETNDVTSWTNFNKLPLFVTATCSFAGYDDANFVTAGEHVLLNPRGGAIALYTTVRAVYSSSNERLTKAVFNQLFEKVDGVHPPIGELLRLGKNSNSADTTGSNSRKFTLLGDPSMQLAFPEYTIQTTGVNNREIKDGQIDTISALQKVTITGIITDTEGKIIPSFNGKIYPTVYDKKTRIANIQNDATSRILPFDVQKNILFKGVASVEEGRFSFSFVVPKDINYQYGSGKISYYAENGKEDAAGYYNNIIIGGTDTNAAEDEEGPLIEVFMNDSTFVFGGTTNPNPTLLVRLSDESGINVTGSSIGHDLTAILDDQTNNTITLNDFYEATINDHTKGTVRFPLKDLSPGTHQIKVKAWDIFNNSSEGLTEFIVATSEKIALERILNYPNPFTTSTTFQFVHNLTPGQLLDVQIRIFTISGRLVKTIEEQVVSEGNTVRGITWDGRDEYGGHLARGVYVYKVNIRPQDSSRTGNSGFEKLVILK